MKYRNSEEEENGGVWETEVGYRGGACRTSVTSGIIVTLSLEGLPSTFRGVTWTI